MFFVNSPVIIITGRKKKNYMKIYIQAHFIMIFIDDDDNDDDDNNNNI